MSTRQIAHNFIAQTVGKVASLIIGLVVIGMITRYLGRGGFGEYTIVFSFLQFFGIIIDMGLTLIVIQELSLPNADKNKIFSNIFTLRFVSAIIILALAPLFAFLFPYSSIVKQGILIVSFSFLFGSFSQLFMGLYQKELKMAKFILSEVIGRSILFLGTAYVIYSGRGILFIFSAAVLANFASVIVQFLFAKSFINIRPAFDMDVWGKIIKKTWPVAVAIIFNLIYFKLDTILLSVFKGEDVVGIYGAPYKILEVLITFPYMFLGLIMPFLTYSWAQNNHEVFREYMQKGFNLLSILAWPMIIGVYFLAEKIMVLIAGQEFAISGAPLRILIVATALIFIGSLFGHIVVCIEKQKQAIWIYGITAVVATIGYLIFIPRYSYFGAAYMTVVAEAMVAVSTAWLVIKTTKIYPSFQVFLKSLAASLLMGAVLFFIKEWNIFSQMILAALVYFALLFAFGAIKKSTILDIIGPKSEPQNP